MMVGGDGMTVLLLFWLAATMRLVERISDGRKVTFMTMIENETKILLAMH